MLTRVENFALYGIETVENVIGMEKTSEITSTVQKNWNWNSKKVVTIFASMSSPFG